MSGETCTLEFGVVFRVSVQLRLQLPEMLLSQLSQCLTVSVWVGPVLDLHIFWVCLTGAVGTLPKAARPAV
jgi:hypothetical protein